MNITEEVTFDKEGHIERFPWLRKLFLSLVIILVASLSFGIGRLSVVGKREPIKIEYAPELTSKDSQAITNTNQTASVINSTQKQVVPAPRSFSEVVTSKNSDKYHFPHCPGAKQIKEANKITFESSQAAEFAGYTLAANCKP